MCETRRIESVRRIVARTWVTRPFRVLADRHRCFVIRSGRRWPLCTGVHTEDYGSVNRSRRTFSFCVFLYMYLNELLLVTSAILLCTKFI